jgi:hypothetical protein
MTRVDTSETLSPSVFQLGPFSIFNGVPTSTVLFFQPINPTTLIVCFEINYSAARYPKWWDEEPHHFEVAEP